MTRQRPTLEASLGVRADGRAIRGRVILKAVCERHNRVVAHLVDAGADGLFLARYAPTGTDPSSMRQEDGPQVASPTVVITTRVSGSAQSRTAYCDACRRSLELDVFELLKTAPRDGGRPRRVALS